MGKGHVLGWRRSVCGYKWNVRHQKTAAVPADTRVGQVAETGDDGGGEREVPAREGSSGRHLEGGFVAMGPVLDR